MYQLIYRELHFNHKYLIWQFMLWMPWSERLVTLVPRSSNLIVIFPWFKRIMVILLPASIIVLLPLCEIVASLCDCPVTMVSDCNFLVAMV